MPELNPYPQAGNTAALEINAPSGLGLYGQCLQTSGKVFNQTSKAYEASNPSNWALYVVPLTEVIACTGIYFGNPPAGAGAGVRLLPVYQQAGDAPASTDTAYTPVNARFPLAYVLELNQGGALVSIAPLRPQGGTLPVSLPARQDAVAVAQEILNQLYAARLKLATKSFATITVDGQATTFTDIAKLEASINFWERKVGFLSGRLRRTSTIRLDNWA